MKWSWTIGIALPGTVALSIALVAGRPEQPPEPEHNGIPIRRWLYQLSYGAPGEAGAAFRDMGSDAVPFLLHELRRNDISWVHRMYGTIHPRVPKTVAKVCPAPRYRNRELPERIAVALSHSARASDLVVALNDSSTDVRVASANALRMMFPPPPKSVVEPGLKRAASDRDAQVRAAAEAALESLAAARQTDDLIIGN